MESFLLVEFFLNVKSNQQALVSKSCNVTEISLPENGGWNCDGKLTNDSVPFGTKCWLQCHAGYDLKIGKRRDFHKCSRTGEWRLPLNVELSCHRSCKLLDICKEKN